MRCVDVTGTPPRVAGRKVQSRAALKQAAFTNAFDPSVAESIRALETPPRASTITSTDTLVSL